MEPFWSQMLPEPYIEVDGVTVFHGDCRELLPELAAESVCLVATDPPFLVSYKGRWDADQNPIEGDSDKEWIQPVFSELWRLLKPHSLCLSFYGWPHADTFMGTWKQIGFRPVSLITLVKDRFGFGHFTRSQHETAYLLAKGRPKKPERPISDVLEWEQTFPLLHPNQKPLGAISKLLATYVSAPACVLDPFCGSGTTLVAARALGINAVGIEIEERFCEVTALRLAQQTFTFTAPTSAPEQLTLN
jgi:site-specific DNA-methyltransferase (adenine-specific)